LNNFAPVPYICGMNSTEGSGVMCTGYPPSYFEGFDRETAMKFAEAVGSPFFPVSTHNKARLFQQIHVRWRLIYFSLHKFGDF